MTLVSVGIHRLVSHRLLRPLVVVAASLLVAYAVLIPWAVISPAYDVVALPKSSLWFLPNQTAFTFGNTFALRGYRLQPGANGSTLTVTLYWQADRRPDFDYSVFVHLIDGSGRMVAQNDHPPGDARG